MQFTPKNSLQIDLDITCTNKLISDAYDTKFLWIYEDSPLSWKTHTEQLHTNYMQHAKQWDRLSPICHRKHWRWFTTPIFIPLWTMDQEFGGTLHIVQKYLKYKTVKLELLQDA